MSAVVKAVTSVVKAVANVVEDVVEAVGDVVEEVGHVVENVVEKVGDVVEKVIENPLPVLLAVAGQMVGIPAPLTMGAITAAQGGDLEDIALSMGTAYFAPMATSAISSTVTSSFIEAGFNETFTEVASTSISKGLVNGTIAEVKGGSFEDGFAGGFTGGMVAGGVGEVSNYVRPEILQLAEESGIDLDTAKSIANAGTKAFSAGLTAEITGKGDFATSFTNSAVGSTIDAGTRSLNSTIDEQFKTAATDWNEKDKEGQPVDTEVTGAGVPDDIVGKVTVSSIGFDTTADTTSDSTSDSAQVLADTKDTTNASDTTGETAVSDVSVLPSSVLAQAPKAETADNFADLIGADTTDDGDVDTTLVVDNTGAKDENEVSSDVLDIASALDETTDNKPAVVTPKGALATVSDVIVPQDLDVTSTQVKSDAPINEGAITTNLLAEDLPTSEPVGGLTAVSTKTADEKLAESQGLKPTDITKPLVASVGSLLKSTLRTGTKPVVRKPTVQPKGGLQIAKVAPKKPTPPPLKMDVSKLMPIKKASPSMPTQTLSSSAKLTPVSDIASLTSLLKKTG